MENKDLHAYLLKQEIQKKEIEKIRLKQNMNEKDTILFSIYEKLWTEQDGLHSIQNQIKRLRNIDTNAVKIIVSGGVVTIFLELLSLPVLGILAASTTVSLQALTYLNAHITLNQHLEKENCSQKREEKKQKVLRILETEETKKLENIAFYQKQIEELYQMINSMKEALAQVEKVIYDREKLLYRQEKTSCDGFQNPDREVILEKVLTTKHY